jgi:hypothetical protein
MLSLTRASDELMPNKYLKLGFLFPSKQNFLPDFNTIGSFGQIYCLNSLKIKDDSVWYPRQHMFIKLLA